MLCPSRTISDKSQPHLANCVCIELLRGEGRTITHHASDKSQPHLANCVCIELLHGEGRTMYIMLRSYYQVQDRTYI